MGASAPSLPQEAPDLATRRRSTPLLNCRQLALVFWYCMSLFWSPSTGAAARVHLRVLALLKCGSAALGALQLRSGYPPPAAYRCGPWGAGGHGMRCLRRSCTGTCPRAQLGTSTFPARPMRLQHQPAERLAAAAPRRAATAWAGTRLCSCGVWACCPTCPFAPSWPCPSSTSCARCWTGAAPPPRSREAGARGVQPASAAPAPARLLPALQMPRQPPAHPSAPWEAFVCCCRFYDWLKLEDINTSLFFAACDARARAAQRPGERQPRYLKFFQVDARALAWCWCWSGWGATQWSGGGLVGPPVVLVLAALLRRPASLPYGGRDRCLPAFQPLRRPPCLPDHAAAACRRARCCSRYC